MSVSVVAPNIELGLAAHLEYNGLLLHNLLTSSNDRYIITEIDGLADAEVRDSRDLNPSAHGETAFPSYYGGRTITLTGYIKAGNLIKMRQMQNDLKATFGGMTDSRLYFRTGDLNRDVYIFCRKNAPIVMREVQAHNYFRRDFLISLRAPNPHFSSVNLFTREKFFDDVTGVGRVYNRTYPLMYNVLLDSEGFPTVAANPFTVTNNGNARANPLIIIYGDVTDPSVSNMANGQVLKLQGLITGSDHIRVDIGDRTLKDAAGNSRYSLLSTQSDWPVIEPGLNTFNLAATSIGAGAKVIISFADSWF